MQLITRLGAGLVASTGNKHFKQIYLFLLTEMDRSVFVFNTIRCNYTALNGMVSINAE